mmetsp:Transcript_6383/g.13947  ORF Transcript_6383/g.13947 Transcript_6383/m.13947 type:complete len:615 (+) Transcript_6383:64-1908(+)|eukprot:CAMPEP_0178434260 /NCGR_PEP_ID=MMETSP0689_2-20121128/33332_1 /TAXON_ID=160604 /ORGANISM="Amphidinium massartii, Strain CS-259" /LENGTH=614 /DNA_ID=CAMNT_0020056319 /DNA_START=17 /DNA_END=1861 /DNA_ORIENTATION=+
MGSACARRRGEDWDVKAAKAADETPFWEHPAANKEPQEDKPVLQGVENATHLKDEGKEKFLAGDIELAIERWSRALDICLESSQDGSGMSVAAALSAALGPGSDPAAAIAKLAAGQPLRGGQSTEDPEMTELRITLMLNLAQAHKMCRRWRESIVFCNYVLNERPDNLKALFRKAGSLGELDDMDAAEEVLVKMEALGPEGQGEAKKKREEWKQKKKEAENRQKKMWSAAIEKRAGGDKGSAPEVESTATASQELDRWTQPKLERMSVFDLRKKGIEWQEESDFSDDIWLNGLGLKHVAKYERTALPLTLLAAGTLAELEFPPDMIVHCLLDGNIAPFAKPHDWGVILERCPQVQTLTVVYIDVGSVEHLDKKKIPMPYGILLRPSEEGRVGDRVARAARFLGTYDEFLKHARDLPGLVRPTVALLTDMPLYGSGDSDLQKRVAALKAFSDAGAMTIITQGGEVTEPGGPKLHPQMDPYAKNTAAVLSVGLEAQMAVEWLWNRFVVPLDRGERGILAAHALLGVVRPFSKAAKLDDIKAALKERGVSLVKYEAPRLMRTDGQESMRRSQWKAFQEKLRSEGRELNPEASEAERRQRMMEFYQFCGSPEGPPPLM